MGAPDGPAQVGRRGPPASEGECGGHGGHAPLLSAAWAGHGAPVHCSALSREPEAGVVAVSNPAGRLSLQDRGTLGSREALGQCEAILPHPGPLGPAPRPWPGRGDTGPGWRGRSSSLSLPIAPGRSGRCSGGTVRGSLGEIRRQSTWLGLEIRTASRRQRCRHCPHSAARDTGRRARAAAQGHREPPGQGLCPQPRHLPAGARKEPLRDGGSSASEPPSGKERGSQ